MIRNATLKCFGDDTHLFQDDQFSFLVLSDSKEGFQTDLLSVHCQNISSVLITSLSSLKYIEKLMNNTTFNGLIFLPQFFIEIYDIDTFYPERIRPLWWDRLCGVNFGEEIALTNSIIAKCDIFCGLSVSNVGFTFFNDSFTEIPLLVLDYPYPHFSLPSLPPVPVRQILYFKNTLVRFDTRLFVGITKNDLLNRRTAFLVEDPSDLLRSLIHLGYDRSVTLVVDEYLHRVLLLLLMFKTYLCPQFKQILSILFKQLTFRCFHIFEPPILPSAGLLLMTRGTYKKYCLDLGLEVYTNDGHIAKDLKFQNFGINGTSYAPTDFKRVLHCDDVKEVIGDIVFNEELVPVRTQNVLLNDSKMLVLGDDDNAVLYTRLNSSSKYINGRFNSQLSTKTSEAVVLPVTPSLDFVQSILNSSPHIANVIKEEDHLLINDTFSVSINHGKVCIKNSISQSESYPKDLLDTIISVFRNHNLLL
ncbi:hypothetical protein PCE1_000992 [Barthelona sp. PCE]